MGTAYLLIIVATFVWASMGVFVKTIELGAVVLALIRTGVPTMSLLLFFLARGKAKSLLLNKNPYLYLASLVNGLSFILYFNGFLLTSVGKAIITLYTWPLLVPVVARVLLKERITKRVYLSLAVAFVGMVLVVGSQSSESPASPSKDFWGVLSMAFASIINAVFVVLMKKGSVKVNAFESVFYQNAMGFVFYGLLVWLVPVEAVSMSRLGVALAYNFVLGVVGFGLFFYALGRLSVNVASLLTFAEVVFAVVMGVLLLGEELSLAKVVGMLLIIVPCMVASHSVKTKTMSGWQAKP